MNKLIVIASEALQSATYNHLDEDYFVSLTLRVETSSQWRINQDLL
jgi:hypothetical protein